MRHWDYPHLKFTQPLPWSVIWAFYRPEVRQLAAIKLDHGLSWARVSLPQSKSVWLSARFKMAKLVLRSFYFAPRCMSKFVVFLGIIQKWV
jgi:hypothetical protein